MANLILLPTLNLPANWREHLPFVGLYHWLTNTESEGITILVRFDHLPPLTFRISHGESRELAENLLNARQLLRWLAPRLSGREQLIQQLLELTADSYEQPAPFSEKTLKSIRRQLAIVLEQPDTEFSLSFEYSELLHILARQHQERNKQKTPGMLQLGQNQSRGTQSPATGADSRQTRSDSHREQRQDLNPQKPADRQYPDLDTEDLEESIEGLDLTLPHYTVVIHQTRYHVSKAEVLSQLLQPATGLHFNCQDCNGEQIPYQVIASHAEAEGHRLVCDQCNQFQPGPSPLPIRRRMLEVHTQSQCRDYRGKNPVTIVDRSITALHFMFRFGTEESLMELLQEFDLPITTEHLQQTDVYRKTLLHELTGRGFQRAIRIFVSRFHSIMEPGILLLQDCYGRTPLHYLFETQPEPLILELADSMYSLTTLQSLAVPDHQGQTPLDILHERGLKTAVTQLSRRAEFQSGRSNPELQASGGLNTLEQSVEPSAPPLSLGTEPYYAEQPTAVHERFGPRASLEILYEGGKTLLHIAAEAGHEEQVESLILQRARLNVQDDLGRTPLHLATEKWKHFSVYPLLKHGADTEVTDNRGQTALHYAAAAGNPIIVDILMGHHANVEAEDGDGFTPLHLAAINDKKMIASFLIGTFQANLEARDKNNRTPLHKAIMEGSVKTALALIERGANIDARADKGASPLHLAALRNQLDVVTALIQKQANPNAIDRRGNMPLHYAAVYGHSESSKILLANNANPSAQDENGNTPLHTAVLKNDREYAETLMQHGADLVASDEQGSTPLHIATREGYTEIVITLVKRGADHNARNHQGETALEIAATKGNEKIAAILLAKGATPKAVRSAALSLAVLNDKVNTALLLVLKGADRESLTPALSAKLNQWLSDAGIMSLVASSAKNRDAAISEKTPAKEAIVGMQSVNERNKDGLTRLHTAAHNGHLNDILMLIGQGADLTAKDNDDGWTPLHFAVLESRVEIIALLVTVFKADLEAGDKKGRTPLSYAVTEGDVETTRFLIRLGASSNARDSNGTTLLQYAAAGNYGQIITQLVMGHADPEVGVPTPLHIAVSQGNVDAALALMEHGANKEASKDGKTPLEMALGLDKTEIALALFREGAKTDHLKPAESAKLQQWLREAGITLDAGFDERDEKGRTKLHTAVMHGDLRAIRELISQGADLEVRSDDEKTPLHYARRADVTRELIKHCACIEAKDKWGQTPLHSNCMSEYGSNEVVEVLLEHGACIKVKDKCGYTPLHSVAAYGNSKVAETLIKNGASLEAQGDSGETPLWYAASNGNTEVARLLIQKEAHSEVKDSLFNFTPLAIAVRLDHKETALALIQGGASMETLNSKLATKVNKWLREAEITPHPLPQQIKPKFKESELQPAVHVESTVDTSESALQEYLRLAIQKKASVDTRWQELMEDMQLTIQERAADIQKKEAIDTTLQVLQEDLQLTIQKKEAAVETLHACQEGEKKLEELQSRLERLKNQSQVLPKR